METGKVIPIIDETGNKLPKNMSKQFRDVQSGIEYLKDAADNITVELKGVTNKLDANTTDLSKISTKVNEIDSNLKKLTKTVGKNFKVISNNFTDVIKLIIEDRKNLNDRISKLDSQK